MHALGKLFEHNIGEQNRGILEDITTFLKDAPIVISSSIPLFCSPILCSKSFPKACISAFAEK